MAVITHTYVDPSIAGDSGAGTKGDPYGDFEWSVSAGKLTQNAGGDQINVKAGTAETLVAPVNFTANYGTPAQGKPLLIKGYTTDENDGGLYEISGGGVVGIHTAATQYVSWADGVLTNTGAADILNLGKYSHVNNVEFHLATGDGLVTSVGEITIASCNFHNIGGIACRLHTSTGGWANVFANYFKSGAEANDFTFAIQGGYGLVAARNIISIDGATIGIQASFAARIINNAILSAGGTGSGINIVGENAAVLSNLVEGFSGGGGKGIAQSNDGNLGLHGMNAAYNNATNYPTTLIINDVGDNESLGASPFDKSGADTFANRFTYFGPVDTGNVRGGAYPSGCRLDKGAVQHADPAGGGGTVNLLQGKLAG